MTTANENAIDEWIELERMRELWHSFELSKKKEVLDKQALDIAEQREKSANARKNLAQDTKCNVYTDHRIGIRCTHPIRLTNSVQKVEGD